MSLKLLQLDFLSAEFVSSLYSHVIFLLDFFLRVYHRGHAHEKAKIVFQSGQKPTFLEMENLSVENFSQRS